MSSDKNDKKYMYSYMNTFDESDDNQDSAENQSTGENLPIAVMGQEESQSGENQSAEIHTLPKDSQVKVYSEVQDYDRNGHVTWYRKIISIPAVSFVCVVICILSIVGYFWYNNADNRMQRSIVRIEAALKDYDFDKARNELNTLTSNKKWNANKKELAAAIDKAEKDYLNKEGIQTPMSAKEAKKHHYSDVAKLFEEAGFKDIRVDRVYDKPFFLSGYKDENVRTITVDGDDSFKADKLFLDTAPVRITYYRN